MLIVAEEKLPAECAFGGTLGQRTAVEALDAKKEECRVIAALTSCLHQSESRIFLHSVGIYF